MAGYHEVQVDGGWSARHDSPEQVLHHGVIFVLHTAGVNMQAGTGLAQTVVAEEVIEHADSVLAHLPVSLASLITKLICRGIASQHTPNMAAFRGVKKYMGPG